MKYGPLTVDRHQRLKEGGLDLHVFVRGVDETHRCRYVDDTRPYAELFRFTVHGRPYVDEDGSVAIEICTDEIEVREGEVKRSRREDAIAK